MPGKPENIIKVLVVDDSAFMRKIISDILNLDEEIKVIDTAKNGLEAIEKVKILNPDVVTLDVEMPVMNGLECLKEILAITHVPIIMLSSYTKEGAEATIKALEGGAIDFITKPTNVFKITDVYKKQELIEKVKIARNIKRRKRVHTPKLEDKPKLELEKSENIEHIVAIGASTGGPRALQDVIPYIPGNVPAAFLVVQHMPAGFTKSLAERLDGMSQLTVKEAEDGEKIKPGYAYIAPGGYHMMVKRKEGSHLEIMLSKEPPLGGHRPSVNVMMESLSDTGFEKIIGVIMTGMGSDGSEGIKKIKNNNKGFIIAQDEKSSIVYGMPKVAARTGSVDAIVTLKSIAKEIMKIVGGR